MDRRLSLPAITRDKRDSPSRSRLERHQGSHVDGIQRFNRHISLNKVFSPIQDQRTHFHQFLPCPVTLNPTQQRHENLCTTGPVTPNSTCSAFQFPPLREMFCDHRQMDGQI